MMSTQSLMTRVRARLGQIRISLRLHKWTAWVGRLSLMYNRFLNPGFRVGRKPRVRGRFCVMMHGDSEIVFGDRVHIISDWKRSNLGLYSRVRLMTFPGARIVIGDHVLLAGTVMTCRKSIEIGEGTMVAPNVVIVDSDFHLTWPPEQRFHLSPTETADPVKIGKRVWIGVNAIILKGVTIGDDAVIGAGSVVTRDVPPNTLAAGSPARVIRRLDEQAAEGSESPKR